MPGPQQTADDVVHEVSYCAPSRYGHFQAHGTCLRRDELVQLARLYNRTLDDGSWRALFGSAAAAASSKKRVDEGRDDLYEQLRERLGPDDYTWLELPWVKKARSVYAALEDAFRPKLPASWSRNAHQWLNTDDIDRVMQQYQSKFADFRFLGVFPIDFDSRTFFGNCIANEMCKLDLRDLRAEGVRHFGAVLNLDRHDQRGSHWVAVYGNLDADALNYGMHYYDSVGRPGPPEVSAFMSRMAEQMDAMNNMVVEEQRAKAAGGGRRRPPAGHRRPRAAAQTYNRVRRQFKNTECGIFAMYYLVCCMTEAVAVSDIWRAMTSDDIIHSLRYVFYRPSDSESRAAAVDKWLGEK